MASHQLRPTLAAAPPASINNIPFGPASSYPFIPQQQQQQPVSTMAMHHQHHHRQQNYHQHFPNAHQSLMNNNFGNGTFITINDNITNLNNNFAVGGIADTFRPFTARPLVVNPQQLRRASSASIEAIAERKGNRFMDGTNNCTTTNGVTRPASLQHHEVLLLNAEQRRRSTPLSRKFEPGLSIFIDDGLHRREHVECNSTGGKQQSQLNNNNNNINNCRIGEEEAEEDGNSNNKNGVHSFSTQAQTFHRNNSLSLMNTIGNNNEFTAKQTEQQQSQSALPGLALPMFHPHPPPSLPPVSNSNPTTAPIVLQSSMQQHNVVTSSSVDNNVTLWQFLLELLAANDHPNLIQWTNNEGEFKLHDAEAVARLWGTRKGKPNMNYDKLSRALRYYYDKNIIKKVIGQKFVYRFVMDGKQSIAGADGIISANPELVLYAMNKAKLNESQKRDLDARNEQMQPAMQTTIAPNCFAQQQHSQPTPSTETKTKMSSSLCPLNPSGTHHQNATNVAHSPANSSCSPTSSVESSSGVSSGSAMSSGLAATIAGDGNNHFGNSFVQIKLEPGTTHQNQQQQHVLPPTTSAAVANSITAHSQSSSFHIEKVRATRKRKSPLVDQQQHQRIMTTNQQCQGNNRGSTYSISEHMDDEASAPKIGCISSTVNTVGPSLCRRARPQPLDLTSVNNNNNNNSSASVVNHLTGQMSQMVASSPLLFALQQQQQQQSPLLSAALNVLSNYAASPMANVASPSLAHQAAAFQLASNLVASLSPNVNNVASGFNANQGNTTGHCNYALSSGLIANNTTLNAPSATSSLYNQLQSALTTPINQQMRTPHQQLSNSAMISAVINHLTNRPNTPFQQQQQQQQLQPQQQQSLFQFPPSSNMASISHTLAMLSSPGLTGQSPFPFINQMAALQTPKFPTANMQNAAAAAAAITQRSPDSLKTPMGGLSFEFGQVLAAAAANKK